MKTEEQLRDEVLSDPSVAAHQVDDEVQRRLIDANGPADPDPDPEPSPDVSPLKGRLRIPEDRTGHYVVLWAPKPGRGQRARYEEVDCVKAQDPDHAKRIVMELDGRSPKPYDQRGEVAKWLADRAGDKGGILLRAVPAINWPQDVEPTTFVRPEPILKIG